MDRKPIAFCLMGPTATGKTALALALAKQINIEIINVDSAQVYKDLDIGTGKPPLEIRSQVPHHLMGFLDPKTPYSAAQFRLDAIDCMHDIYSRRKIPLLVGGTMLYFKVLQEGISSLPGANIGVRERLAFQAKQQGLHGLYQRLEILDPLIAVQIKPQDTQRIMRALEVLELTGKPMSYWLSLPKEKGCSSFHIIPIALTTKETPRSVLHERIAKRFEMMLEQGLISEVEKLMGRNDLNETLPSMRAVGYRQVWQYLSKNFSYEEMRHRAIAATRQLAKRQLTWLRGWHGLITIDFLDKNSQRKIFHIMDEILQARQLYD